MGLDVSSSEYVCVEICFSHIAPSRSVFAFGIETAKNPAGWSNVYFADNFAYFSQSLDRFHPPSYIFASPRYVLLSVQITSRPRHLELTEASLPPLVLQVRWVSKGFHAIRSKRRCPVRS
jgi:hypothetical protein